jgi:hypothetical protein
VVLELWLKLRQSQGTSLPSRGVYFNVAHELHALQSINMVINNREEVEGIINPSSQVITMLEAVCHNIDIIYNPSIKLNIDKADYPYVT